MARKSAYLKNRKSKNIRFLLSIILILVLSSVFFAYANKSMESEIRYIENELSSNQKKLDDINEEITSLSSDYNIRNTDEFKEKIAKDRLGMTKESGEDTSEGSN